MGFEPTTSPFTPFLWGDCAIWTKLINAISNSAYLPQDEDLLKWPLMIIWHKVQIVF